MSESKKDLRQERRALFIGEKAKKPIFDHMTPEESVAASDYSSTLLALALKEGKRSYPVAEFIVQD